MADNLRESNKATNYAKKFKQVRRSLALLLLVIGLIDLISALTPPVARRFEDLLHDLPIQLITTANALQAIFGVILIFLARAIRRGNKYAFFISISLLSLSILTNAAKGLDIEESVLNLATLICFLYLRNFFKANTDMPSLASGLVTIIGLFLVTTFVSTTVITGVSIYQVHHNHKMRYSVSLYHALIASLARMVGINYIELPKKLNLYLSPCLLAIGLLLIVLLLIISFRPVKYLASHTHRDQRQRAKQLVFKYPNSTLDYFSLRNDKSYFFSGESFLSYGIFNGISIVSPDPIGPAHEKRILWKQFREFAHEQGWVLCAIGISRENVDLYQADSMTTVYMGDEALVDVKNFQLKGNDFKSLRQAYNRIYKYGYRALICDPRTLDAESKASIRALMPKARRGNSERGFSMTLGRIFDPDDDLLMCVVMKDNNIPVAFCQFVPAPSVNGYSLDLMRRDPSKSHPNGLLDFAIISTIYYLREAGFHKLSLNFATWRAFIAGERDDTKAAYLKKRLIKVLSDSMQIESLWKFNAKYFPEWIERYAALDALEYILPGLIALAKAESFTDLPVIGRFFERKASV